MFSDDVFVADGDLSMYSPSWLFGLLEKGKFDSEMEICVLVVKWLHLHAEHMNKQTLSRIVKAVRVSRLRVYFLKQILLQCPFFDLTLEKIEEIAAFQNSGIGCESLPGEWLLPEREFLDKNPFIEVYRWTTVDLRTSDFFSFKISALLNKEPLFIHYFGVLAVPTIEFKAPKVTITISTFSCIFPDLLRSDKPVTDINCEFKCQFIMGKQVQEQSGIFCDSSVTLSCNILGRDQEQDFFEQLETFSLVFYFRRFE